MPKLKTNKGVAKRVRITKNGKVKRKGPGRRHLLSHKSSKRKSDLRKDRFVEKSYANSFKAVIHD